MIPTRRTNASRTESAWRLLKGGKMLMVLGGLTEPAAWIRVIADVVMESGSMSASARLRLAMRASGLQGTP